MSAEKPNAGLCLHLCITPCGTAIVSNYSTGAVEKGHVSLKAHRASAIRRYSARRRCLLPSVFDGDVKPNNAEISSVLVTFFSAPDTVGAPFSAIGVRPHKDNSFDCSIQSNIANLSITKLIYSIS